MIYNEGEVYFLHYLYFRIYLYVRKYEVSRKAFVNGERNMHFVLVICLFKVSSRNKDS